MPIGPARMPLSEHLGELRMRLVRIVVALLIGICVFYLASATLIEFLVEPISEYLPAGQLTTLTAFEGFTVRIKVAAYASVVACMPIILWQILAFLLPALKPNERKWFVPTFAVAVILFIVGTVFCYLVILDPAFGWLTDQSAGFAEVQAQASNYINTILGFELAFGLSFELPIIIFYLVIFDIVPYKKLRESWRVVYVILMVASAMLTADSSPVTMLLMFAALVVLYEASLLIARIVLNKRIKKQNAELAEQEAEEAAEAEAEAEANSKAITTTTKKTVVKKTSAKKA